MSEKSTLHDPGDAAVAAALDMIHALRGSIRQVTAKGLGERFAGAPGEVVDFAVAVAAIVRLNEREARGGAVDDDEIRGLVDGLVAAAERLGAWTPLARLQVIAALLELLTGYDLGWLGACLVDQVPELDLAAMSDGDRQLAAAQLASVVEVRIAHFLAQQEADDDAVDLLELANALATLRPDDEVLREALVEGLRHQATLECWEIMTPIREEELAAATLPDGAREAVAELVAIIELPRFVELSLALLVADLVASGALPADRPPRQLALAAFAFLYEVDNDETFEGPQLMTWAGLSAKSLRTLRTAAEAVLEWTPDGSDAFDYQCQRWRVSSLDPGMVPSRFVNETLEPEPYGPETAAQVLAELAALAWQMVHPGEVLQYLVERFDLGDGEELDEAFLDRAIALWKERSPVVKALLAEHPELEAELTLR